jgi:Na+-driven multidrug efflux pump
MFSCFFRHTAILQKMLLFLSMTFCGHLGKESLDGVALATTVS